MSSDYDASEFVDGDYLAHKTPGSGAAGGVPPRAPTREEVEGKVGEAHAKLAELKRAQEELERERAALEETRRRQMEFQTGRQEMVQHLTRGLGLLEEAEFNARRDAEQMAKEVTDLREALAKIQAIREETWTRDNFTVELTRALTALENARMEYNSARLKFAVLSGEQPHAEPAHAEAPPVAPSLLSTHSFGELCRVGLALTWPVAIAVLLAVAAIAAMALRR